MSQESTSYKEKAKEFVFNINRKLSDILKEYKGKQITGALADGQGGHCALGVLGQAFGVDDKDMRHTGPSSPVYNKIIDTMKEYGFKGSAADIFMRNDRDYLPGSPLSRVIEYLEDQGL